LDTIRFPMSCKRGFEEEKEEQVVFLGQQQQQCDDDDDDDEVVFLEEVSSKQPTVVPSKRCRIGESAVNKSQILKNALFPFGDFDADDVPAGVRAVAPLGGAFGVVCLGAGVRDVDLEIHGTEVRVLHEQVAGASATRGFWLISPDPKRRMVVSIAGAARVVVEAEIAGVDGQRAFSGLFVKSASAFADLFVKRVDLADVVDIIEGVAGTRRGMEAPVSLDDTLSVGYDSEESDNDLDDDEELFPGVLDLPRSLVTPCAFSARVQGMCSLFIGSEVDKAAALLPASDMGVTKVANIHATDVATVVVRGHAFETLNVVSEKRATMDFSRSVCQQPNFRGDGVSACRMPVIGH
jgi:hypothetical protein